MGKMGSLFPSGLFSFESLYVLELDGCAEINNAPPFQGCSNLNVLTLKNMFLTDEVLHEILSYCGMLEKLFLHRIYRLKTPKVMHDNLKVLDLEFLKLDGIEVISET
ncbi:hypothetical protein FRX31_011516 [Thalictrum thalictroides]|uniref:F-box/LRR-repeat protein 15/At3g58940/PEG3-like LRR domain-containing protein n=1 Tax=Thalictrum thalictroides TaxID=46969 RepID=A0A7J6WPN9_THATH|nr:hypothetical protein FRX31_011516 [Thalictrum thalictroides]